MDLITIEQLAEQLQTTPAALHALRYRGNSPRAIRVGKRLLFNQADIDEWLNLNREPARQ